jgi:hypothetical protein
MSPGAARDGSAGGGSGGGGASMLRRPAWSAILGVVLPLLVMWAVASPAALASFNQTVSASATYTSNTLAPPSAPSLAAGSCGLALLGGHDSIVVSWTATASAWADGYEVRRSLTTGGPYTVVGTTSGVGTVTYTDGSVAFSTTYFYVVRATKVNWRSPNTAEVSRATRSGLCL